MRRALLSSVSDVEIRLLRVFITVAECQGIAASELELNIGKSTISKHIADLEQRIGLKLCNRGPSGFGLTPEGETVLGLARKLLGRIDDFQSGVDNIHRNLTGTIKIGIFDQSTTNPNAQVHEAIRMYDRLAPDVSLNITLGTPSSLEARVTDGSLDLAIVPMYRSSSALRYNRLYREKMTLYCGYGHDLYGIDQPSNARLPDLSAYKYAGYGFNSPNLTAGRKLGLRRTAQVQEEEALALLIQSGCYLGYLADHVAANFRTEGKVWPVYPERTSYQTDFGAVTRKRPEPNRKTATFLDCLKNAHEAAGEKKPAVAV